MSKRVLISIGFALVLVVGGILGFIVIPNAVNAFSPPSSAPGHTATVSGNGSNAVMVGGYLYFTSGFVSNASDETLTYKQNEYNKVKGEGALYRIKMPSGTPRYDNGYLEDWNEYKELTPVMQAEKYGTAMNKRVNADDFDLIVPKIAGWEKSAIWIFGDNLVYTSPNNQKNKNDDLLRNNIDFFRVDLRGRGHKKLYTTYSDNVGMNNFTVACVDGNPYVLCFDNRKIVCVDMKGKVTTISGEALNCVFPTVSSYYDGIEIEDGPVQNDPSSNLKNSYSGNMGYVYYTEQAAADARFKGSIMLRYNLSKVGKSDAKEQIRHDNTNQTFHKLANGNLVFEIHQDSDVTLYAVDTVLSDFTDSKIKNSRFRVPQKLHTEELEIYISGQRTNPANFFYITQGPNGTLAMFERKNDMTPRVIPNISDVSKILEVTASDVLYMSGGGLVTSRNIYTGDLTNVPQTPVSVITNETARTITTFHVVDEQGRVSSSRGNMFFFIKEIRQQDGEGEDIITVGALIDSRGQEYILARLDDRFIPPLPENNN